MAEVTFTHTQNPVLPPDVGREIDNFEAEVQRFQRGELSPERFRAFRLAHGVYGQRQPGVQMVRVKIPSGALTGRQLRRLADISEEFSPTGMSHLTTRQDFQFHFIPLERVPGLLRALAEVGLTTREACGNSVRNVTACPLTGFIADELFDVQPYALATYAYLVRNPFCQQLARKFKIALSSCPEDCAATAIHDIGLVGRVVEENGRGRYGFRVLVGGGLGSTPFTAEVLEEFVPLESFLLTVRGILNVFSEYGNRRNKMKARIKFVVHKQGIQEFRRNVTGAIARMTEEERAEASLLRYAPERSARVVAEHLAGHPARGAATDSAPAGRSRRRERENAFAGASSGGFLTAWAAAGEAPNKSAGAIADWNENGSRGPLGEGLCASSGARRQAAYERWQSCSVRSHKDPERAVVTVMFPLGDVQAPRLRTLAKIVTDHAGDEARVAIHQNLVLPNVNKSDLSALYEGLLACGMAEAGVGTALDVTSCPGADTCGLGITSSKGLTRAIRSELLPMAENGGLDLLRGVTIKISGCPNSCGQHHIANIGLHGVVKKVGGRQVPSYQLHLGGRVGQGEARIGDALDKIPAKNVPRAIAALLRLFQTERESAEAFAEFVVRFPRESLEATLRPFVEEIPADTDPAVDWGAEAPFTTDEIGIGECAGAGTDVAVNPFDNYEAEILQASLFMDRDQWVDALANLNRSQYTLARVLLEKLGKHPDSDYECACEIRAQVIDRGYGSELWNEVHDEIAGLLRTRRPDPPAIRALHGRSLALLEEARTTLPVLERKGQSGSAEIPG